MWSLEELRKKMLFCKACDLYKNGILVELRLGNAAKIGEIELMVIGEAPDKLASEVGVPFQGSLGKILDDWLRILCPSNNFVIVNVMKHFPMGSNGNWRSPTNEEITKCYPYLIKQINLYKPKTILCVGDVSFNTLFSNKKEDFKSAIKQNKKYIYKNINCFVYYHPGWVEMKNFYWNDDINKLAILIKKDEKNEK